ncbi:MAG: carbohydrate kinase family protein [Candidatus Brocadiia bacterium]
MTLLPPDCDARVQVIGPSYLDEIVEVDGPLCHERWVREALPERAGPVRIDYSRTEAEREPLDEPGVFLQVDSPGGDSIRVTEPGATGGHRLLVEEERLFDAGSLGLPDEAKVPPLRTEVPLCGRRLQLGGMGAGYALALGGRLVLPLGTTAGRPDADALKLCEMMEECGVAYQPVLVSGAGTDVTTLLWSSPGDKLPVGRRSACYAVTAEALLERAVPADLNIITSLPNATARSVANALTGWKLFTPSLRNVREGGVEQVVGAVDAMSLNSTEWGALAEPEQVRRCCPLVLVTRGEEGAAVSFRDKTGRLRWTEVPAARLEKGVLDANHAGEAFTAGFLGALLEQLSVAQLRRGEYSEGILREAAWQGSLSAALELTIREMRFPDRAEVLDLRERTPLPGR